MSAENAALGAVLLSAAAADEALTVLAEDDFTSEHNRAVFAAMLEVHRSGDAVTQDTVGLKVPALRVYMTDLADACHTTASAHALIRSVSESATRRRIIAGAVELRAHAESGEDIAELHRMAERLTETQSTSEARTIAAIVDDMLPGFAQPREYYRLGDWGVRLRAGSVTLVGARPSVGKSAFALQEAHGLGERHVKTRIYSYEMSEEEWAERAVARVAGFTADDIDAGLADYRIDAVRHQMDADWSRFVESLDTIGWPVHRVLADMRRFARKGGKVAFIDYIQLMCKQSYDDVTEVSRQIKVTARQTGLAVVALSQLSRKTSTDGKLRPPSMTDLRQSGALEQDADNVVLLHDYDDGRQDDEVRSAFFEQGFITQGREGARLGHVHLAKARRGPRTLTPAWFYGAEQTWEPLDERGARL